MTLKSIVSALGGDLYAGGRRANVPGPGHSAADRSVSLLLSDDRVIIHGFGGADWRQVRDALVAQGLIDRSGRLLAAVHGSVTAGSSPPKPNAHLRRQTAHRLWEEALPLTRGQVGLRHLALRGVPQAVTASNLRFHPAAPLSVYQGSGSVCPALVARISDPDGRLTAVELTYLQPNGSVASSLRVPRKTVGLVPAGAAVRLGEAGPTLLAAEGVITTLSAMSWFALPGWALMAVRNLAVWSPPPGVRRVVIAGDRGAPGEAAAEALRRRLACLGVEADIRLPAPEFGDWNEAVVARRRAEEGRGRAPERRG